MTKYSSKHPELRKAVGRNMRYIREKRRIKARAIANHIGCDVSVVYMWERGNNECGYFILKTMSQIYSCSIDDFFKEDVSEIFKPNRSRLDQTEHESQRRPKRPWNRTMAEEPESVHAPFEPDGVYNSGRWANSKSGERREGSGGGDDGRTSTVA